MTAGHTGSPNAALRAHPQGLAGRRRELALLEQAVEALSGGSPPVIQISGEPGIGKTRLLVELGALAGRSGQTVLWGRAAEFERQVPFGIFTNALEDHLTTIEPDRLGQLGEDRLGLLSRVFPALPSVQEGGPAAGLMDVERYRLHRAMRALLEVMAEAEPLVLVLDDVHWADDGSVELLDHLLRHPPRARLLLALAYRPRQLPVRLGEALTRAVAQGLAESLDVGPLTPAEADDLLPTGIPGTTRQELYRASGGNPFYLDALVRGGAGHTGGAVAESRLEPDGDVPAQVRAALAAELAALTPAQLVVAQAAAVAGEVFEGDLVALIASFDVVAPEIDR